MAEYNAIRDIAQEIRDKLPIENYFAQLDNIRFYKNIGGEMYFKKDDEKRASIAVNPKKQRFKDFSNDQVYGDIFQAVKEFEKINSYKDQVLHLKNKFNLIVNTDMSKYKPSFDRSVLDKNNDKTYRILKVKELESPALLAYMHSRGFMPSNYKDFVKEIHWENLLNEKKNYAVAFKNEEGGYAVRNKYFKGNIGPQSYSLIKLNSKSTQLKMFEGFSDFISYRNLTENKKSNYDALILNSTSNASKAIDNVKGKYNYYTSYFDNNKAGRDVLEKFREGLGEVKDKSYHYGKHEDLNDFLISKQNEVKNENLDKTNNKAYGGVER